MVLAASLDTSSAVVEPRAAHALDADALLGYLRRAAPGASAEPGPLRIRAFAHGQSNPTYLLELGSRRLVLRKKPPGRLLASAHAVEREHAVLAALAAHGAVPVPRPLALCEDASVLGTPFYVMEFAAGTIFTDPSMPTADAPQRTAAYAALADTLAALHAVDPAVVGLAGFGDPARYCARQVHRWARQYEASVPSPCPRVGRLIAWLRANVPPGDAAPARPAIVHGDYRLDNLVFDRSMKVVAILDWELATLGNPWADVAYTCLAYHMPPELPSMRLAAPLPPGVPDEATLLARYCSARGVGPPPPREWAFYLALSMFRLLSILAGVAARARQGNASSAAAAAISSDAVLSALTNAALSIVDRADAGGAPNAAAAPARRSASPPAPSLGAPSARAADLLARVRAFMDAHILPAEEMLTAHARGDTRWTIHPHFEELKAAARAQGLWNLWVPADMAAKLQHLVAEVPEGERATLLGAGLSNLDYAHVCCAMGRSVWAPEVFNCSAPDTGNMEVLARYGTPEQQRRWLVPLLRGHIRSCFAMTEKAVASSDATNVTASIVRDPAGGGYVVDGVKWWTSGAMDPRCKVAVFMGKTDPSGPTHLQQSMILVPMDAPGVTVVRPLLVYGFDDAPHGHAEVHFSRVRVPGSNLLLGEGRGFEIAQGRLGPGRLHHCMRLVGAGERGLELMAQRALSRVAFGRPLAAQGGLREKLARMRISLEGARLLVLAAANALDKVGHKAARGEIAAAKVAAPAAALEVLDAAIQVHGGAGVCQDTPLAHLWAAARTLRIADGPDEVHLGTVAKLELARAAAAPAGTPAGGGVPRHRM